ncbi:hypothetical protein [Hymenobacter terrestris]|uniref:DUF4829 domain-containing protein n=1 Tax=Hymenobacter terrestris TaxID=2748310 RepID=A0ABX2Q4Z1_9BACT|nr:hypothetical protein [Hymenobacter terrestris]NVO86032.1 hypothetical protein [Hymenobacter terrestris]
MQSAFILQQLFISQPIPVSYIMPIRLVLFVLLVLSATSQLACQPTTFRQCPNPHKDPTKRLYNDIVTELIERRFYNMYLPKEQQEIFSKRYQVANSQAAMIADTAWRRTQSIRFQNKLFQDTANFRTFQLVTVPPKNARTPAGLPASFSELRASPDIAAMLTAFSSQQQQAVLDSINEVQAGMSAQEFTLCTARLQAATSEPNWRYWTGQDVQRITLSKVFFNEQRTQAILSFGWLCGPRCGFGEVLLVEQVAGRWRIKQAIQTWIS